MEITVLVENEAGAVVGEDGNEVKAAHGLSFYIESEGKKILVDTGSTSLFSKNAETLGIELADVDMLFISHAHFDHGGGLPTFFRINKKAQVYMHRLTQGKFYLKILGIFPYYIGLNRTIFEDYKDRITFIDNDLELDHTISVLSNFQNEFPRPEGNKTLFIKKNSTLMQDDFTHEIALLIKEPDGNVLFSSCSHSGIYNIVKSASDKHPEKLKAVIGGFHLFNPVSKKSESRDYMSKLAKGMDEFDTTYYTCHCTGKENVAFLKQELCEKVSAIHTGDVIRL
ncbi:MAG: MBL fold metallo-hydrolase [Spirochaetales bacterium]|nr:MBL fold metallo-hydrolase [Spirochaetales bacterium]